MLNISHRTIGKDIKQEDYSSFQKVSLSGSNLMFTRWLASLLLIITLFMFMPWTQNVQTKGKVTALNPEQRPQTLPAAIDGRIERWFVREGDFVQKGDTIVHLFEIKTEYSDPAIIARTEQQAKAKQLSADNYGEKARAMQQQINALEQEQGLKAEQLRNKIQQTKFKITTDSIDLERVKLDINIADRQLKRTESLQQQGIKSVADVEEKRFKIQELNAKLVSTENKLLTTRNELVNARIELNNLPQAYAQKVAKSRSELYASLSSQAGAEADAGKLSVQAANYAQRSQFYFLTAQQDGYITQALKPGIGETVKAGEGVVTIMPAKYELAVELYVKPMDFPLLKEGEEVRFIFDGWPAFVFSGWPGASFGTYRGRIVAIDNFVTTNSKYRVLVAPDEQQEEWPTALRPGSGAEGIILLNNVPLWYEVWRQLNGFPPDFYEGEINEPKMKAPVKSIK